MNRLQIPKYRSHLLLNAIPLKEILFNKRSSEKINLLFVGRLEKQKSIETLLKAVENLKTIKLKKEFQLIIVGDGKLKNELEQLMKQLKLGTVGFIWETKYIDSYYERAIFLSYHLFGKVLG